MTKAFLIGLATSLVLVGVYFQYKLAEKPALPKPEWCLYFVVRPPMTLDNYKHNSKEVYIEIIGDEKYVYKECD